MDAGDGAGVAVSQEEPSEGGTGDALGSTESWLCGGARVQLQSQLPHSATACS